MTDINTTIDRRSTRKNGAQLFSLKKNPIKSSYTHIVCTNMCRVCSSIVTVCT